MNFDMPTRYLARVFVDAQSMQPALERVPDLIKIIGRSVFPQVVTERRPGFPLARRLVLASPVGDWALAMLGDSFDVTASPVDEHGSNMGTWRDFVRHAGIVLSEAVTLSGRTPHRVAVVREGFLRAMPAEEYDGIARRLLMPPPSFKAAPLFEWDWRCARHDRLRVGETDETTNVLLAVRRQQGEMTFPDGRNVGLDRLRVELDVNTAPENTQARFQPPRIRAFFEAALDQHDALAEDLERHIGGTHVH